MEKKKKILLSGIKSSGRMHIGNYFGALKQFVAMQDDYENYVFVANYHSMTTVKDPKLLEKQTIDIVLDYLAVGLDPKKVNLYLQSDVPEVTELTWFFNCIITVPYLQRAHAYKDAVVKNKELNVGLFDYPVLMASDILIQDADIVPVGRDQKQHVEYARDIAEKFNSTYGELFKLPEPVIMEDVEIIKGIDGRKMSKSYGNTIPLFATDEEIKKAVMSIPTDSKAVEESKDPEECNIFYFHKLFSTEVLNDIEKRYREVGMGYKESKEILIENMIAFIKPLREKREELAKDTDYIMNILKEGGNNARARAKKKLELVRKHSGIIKAN